MYVIKRRKTQQTKKGKCFMSKNTYRFTIEVAKISPNNTVKYESYPYIVESSSYERARTTAADYGQTIVRAYSHEGHLAFFRVAH